MGGDQHNRAYDGGRGEQHRQKQQAAPEKDGREKRFSSWASRSRSTPINHRKATPANGTRFNATVTARVSVASHAPGSSGSAGIEVRSSQRINSRSSEKTIPAMAAAFGVFSCA